MALIHATNTLSSLNLTGAGVTVFTYTMTEDARVGISLFLSGMGSSSATITAYVETLDGSNNSYDKFTVVSAKNATVTRHRFEIGEPFFVPSGYKVKVSLISSSGGDSSVNCTWYLNNPNHTVAAPTAAQVADAVWEESFNDHNTTMDGMAWVVDQLIGVVSGIEASTASILDDTSTTGVLLASAHDLYHADINFAVDGGIPRDEYTVTWFKNGTRLTSGVGSPMLEVIKRDGTSLVGSTSMTEIGTTESYKLDVTGGSNLMSPGDAAIVIVTASIDSATRTFSKVISRDAAA